MAQEGKDAAVAATTYQEAIIDYTEDLRNWVSQTEMAWASIHLMIEDGPRTHIDGMQIISEIWDKLKLLYGESELFVRDHALFMISRLDSFKFTSLRDYSREH